MIAKPTTWSERWRLRYNDWLVHSLGRTMFWGEKLRQRFSVMGLFLGSAVVVTMVFGANTKRTMIYQLFSLFLATLLLAFIIVFIQSYLRKNRFSVARHLPDFATVEIPFTYHIDIINHEKTEVYNLRVAERSRLYRPTLHQFLTMTEPNEEQRNIYDRTMGFYRFAWLQQWLRGGVMESLVVSLIKAESEHQLEMPFVPMRRGYIYFSKLRLSQPEPLGLMYTFQDFDVRESVLVLPKRYDIPQWVTRSAKATVQKHGMALASDVGEPEEFHHMREYRAGDSPRHIHWPSLARTGKPLVKSFQDENFTRQALVLDNFADETKTQIFEEAVSVAAGFTMSVDSDDMLLDLMFVGGQHQVEDIVAGRALAHAEQMLEALATVELADEDGFEALANTVLAQATHFGSLVLVLLAWDEPRKALVEQLSVLSVSVRVILIQNKSNAAQNHAFNSGVDPSMFHVLTAGQIQQDLNALDGLGL